MPELLWLAHEIGGLNRYKHMFRVKTMAEITNVMMLRLIGSIYCFVPKYA